jgi:hypothetical protein
MQCEIVAAVRPGARLRDLVDVHNTHCCIRRRELRVSQSAWGGLDYVPTEAEVHQAGEHDDPVVHGIDNVATIQLQ